MYLFFDVETNGLPKNWKAPMTDLANWSRVIQIAWIMFDANGKRVAENCDFVKPDGWTIPKDEFWQKHGYSTERNEEIGVPMKMILGKFIHCINQSEYLIAHNMDFDYNVVGAECLRYGMRANNRPQRICTMKSSVELCALPGKHGLKFPKLEELYQKLFGQKFDNAHDALADITSTAQCFFELVNHGVIKL